MKGEEKLKNKVLFVSGGTRNTGLAVAEKFAGEGYDVALTSRIQEEANKTAAELVQKYGIHAKGYELSLRSVAKIREVFADVAGEFGRLDCFVAVSANLGMDMDILHATEDQYDDVMDVNVKGNYFCCQQAALLMKKHDGGSIVLIGSCHYKATIWGRSLYTTSKGAIASLTRSLAIELGVWGIRANCIVAGSIHTDRWDSATAEENDKRRANYPVGREAYGVDLANGVWYLGTELSGAVTGTDLTIDSGIGVCLLPYDKGAALWAEK